jgi:cobalt-zinc-cadmium efflux system protein
MSAGHHHTDQPIRLLTVCLCLTMGFMVIEVVAGLYTGSIALLADAGHMFSDGASLAVALVAAKLAIRPPDHHQTMGYQRAEVLGAAINAGALLVLAVWIGTESLGRFGNPQDIIALPMLFVATFGLLINLLMFWLLVRNAHSLNIRAALWHVAGDALGSVGAIVASLLILLKGWVWADPLISLFLCVILIIGAGRILKEVLAVLMHSVPAHADIPTLESVILKMEGVEDIHDLHVWAMKPGMDVLTVHIVLKPNTDTAEICSAVRHALQHQLPSAHITVQPEPSETTCAQDGAPGHSH